MEDQRDESLMDKIKNALGLGSDERSPDAVRDDAYAPTAGAGAASADAGYSEPFTEDVGGPVNRPTGPDYGASDLAEDEFGAGLDRETVDGTRAADTGPAIGGEPYDTVSGPGPMGGGATMGTGSGLGAGQAVDESEWTRGGAASGEGPFESDRDVVDQERRETGI